MSHRNARHATPKLKSHKRRYLLTALIAPLFIGGAAYAYFDLNQATSHVNVASSPSFTITITPPTGAPLLPGSGSQTISFSAINQLNRPQTINSITYAMTSDQSGGILNTVTGAYDDACLASWFNVSGVPSIPPPTVVQQGQTLSGTVAVSMTNPTASQDACEGDSPQISVTLN